MFHTTTARMLLLLPLLAHASISSDLSAQETQDYVIPGPTAWSTAKPFGFAFYPIAGSGQTVTSPRDGLNTKLRGIQKNLLGFDETVTLAQVVGGNASVNRPPSGTRTTTFRFFADRTLQPGWSVVKVDLTGGFIWDRQVTAGSRDLSFQVKASSTTTTTGMAVIKTVTLRGPAGANWADAFAGPKLYTLSGIDAWSAGKQYGFTFRPLQEGLNPNWAGMGTIEVTTPHDGYRTVMIAKAGGPLGKWCTQIEGGGCIVAQIVGGNLSLTRPIQPYFRNQTVRFGMFGAKRLAPGWVMKSITVSNGTWIRQPVANSDDLYFELELTSIQDQKPPYAIVSRVVLEGPSSASSWQDAFKGAINR